LQYFIQEKNYFIIISDDRYIGIANSLAIIQHFLLLVLTSRFILFYFPPTFLSMNCIANILLLLSREPCIIVVAEFYCLALFDSTHTCVASGSVFGQKDNIW